AMDAAGDFVVAWSSVGQDGSGEGIYARTFHIGGDVQSTNDFKVNTFTTGRQFAPGAAMDAAGDFVVTWSSYGQDAPGAYGFYGQRSNSSATPQGSEFRVNDYTTNTQVKSRVAIDPVGNFTVAWESYLQDGDKYGIYAQRYTAAGLAQGEFRVNTY